MREQATQLETVRSERDDLLSRLDEAEQRLDAALQGGSTGGDDSDDELPRRYELAMEDLRDVKSENEQLRQQLANANATASVNRSDMPAGSFDWESQKRRLLAQLDGVEMDDSVQAEEKYRAEEAIQVTERVIVDKDRQITELREQLERQDEAKPTEEVAVGANAVADMLDQDELILQERENLKRIQDDWRDKLRQAEIDVSVERAKIARERRELEGKLSDFESQCGESAGNGNDQQATGQAKGGRRWLAKPGLGGPDDE